MPSIETLISRAAEWTVTATATNSAATATQAANATGTHYITGVTVSGSAAAAAAAIASVKDGTTVIDTFYIQTGTTQPIHIEYTRPLKCSGNSAAAVTCAALGSGVLGLVSIRGFTAQGLP